MSGKQIAECGLRIADSKAHGDLFSNPQSELRIPQSKGFTLLELMIVISIIVILALVVMPVYNGTIRATREAVLRDNLFQMRKLLDQYAADKQKLPQDLNDLINAGYLRELPEDPMTGQTDWVAVAGEDPNALEGGSGIVNVCSSSADTSSEGTTYNNCDAW